MNCEDEIKAIGKTIAESAASAMKELSRSIKEEMSLELKIGN